MGVRRLTIVEDVAAGSSVVSRSFLRNIFGSNDDPSPPEPEADIVPSSELPFPEELLQDTFLRVMNA